MANREIERERERKRERERGMNIERERGEKGHGRLRCDPSPLTGHGLVLRRQRRVVNQSLAIQGPDARPERNSIERPGYFDLFNSMRLFRFIHAFR